MAVSTLRGCTFSAGLSTNLSLGWGDSFAHKLATLWLFQLYVAAHSLLACPRVCLWVEVTLLQSKLTTLWLSLLYVAAHFQLACPRICLWIEVIVLHISWPLYSCLYSTWLHFLSWLDHGSVCCWSDSVARKRANAWLLFSYSATVITDGYSDDGDSTILRLCFIIS